MREMLSRHAASGLGAMTWSSGVTNRLCELRLKQLGTFVNFSFLSPMMFCLRSPGSRLSQDEETVLYLVPSGRVCRAAPRMAIATSPSGRNLMAAGSDDERSQGGRHVPNDAPTVPSYVLDQDIARRQHHLRAIVELECHVARAKHPQIRRLAPV